MVKRVFLVIVLSLNVLLGFSQKSNFGGGLFFGNTFSGMSADNIPGYWKTGITTGLFGHIKVVDNPDVRINTTANCYFHTTNFLSTLPARVPT